MYKKMELPQIIDQNTHCSNSYSLQSVTLKIMTNDSPLCLKSLSSFIPSKSSVFSPVILTVMIMQSLLEYCSAAVQVVYVQIITCVKHLSLKTAT